MEPHEAFWRDSTRLLRPVLRGQDGSSRVTRRRRSEVSIPGGPDALNDDALGRALDAVHEAGIDGVLSMASFSALDFASVPLERLHDDTHVYVVLRSLSESAG